MQKCIEIVDLSLLDKILKVVADNVLFSKLSIKSCLFMPTDVELFKNTYKSYTET